MFEPFPKIPRLSREMVVTEKIDGTNAQVLITEEPVFFVNEEDVGEDLPAIAVTGGHYVYAGSRKRFITPEDDNFGFARWVVEHAEELVQGLGPGRHFGEWWGRGIQRNYGLDERRFSLFNVGRWKDANGPYGTAFPAETAAFAPECCHVVPVLFRGEFDTLAVQIELGALAERGSYAAPGFMKPEGVVVYHTQGNVLFKQTLEGDTK